MQNAKYHGYFRRDDEGKLPMNATVKNNLKTFSWLVRREFWENKGLFLWVPVAIAFVLFLLFLTVEILFKEVLSSESYQIERQFYGSAKTALMIIESNKHHVSDMSRFFLQVSLIIGAFLSSFYLLGALHNDRRDRSILFWKSMPVSDISEVFSKLAFPLLMTPLICILFAFCSYFFAGLLVAILTKFGPYDLFSTIMQNMDMYKTPLQLLSLLPFYILWSLPTVG
jgi:ABC-2 type transport system permease protein